MKLNKDNSKDAYFGDSYCHKLKGASNLMASEYSITR